MGALLETGKSSNEGRGSTLKLQSAMEYLSTYGFALLILVVIAAILYVILTVPQAIPSTQCNFNGYINCRLLTVGSNAHSTRAILLFSNPQQYQLQNVSVTINITGVGTFSGKCSPNVVISGGDIECVINSNATITQNQLANGAITVTATICTYVTGSGCGSPVQQSYSGTFITHVNPLLPPPTCNMSLTVSNSTQFAGVGHDAVTANVKLLGYEIAGATVNFTSNKTTTLINPEYVNTDSNGNATTAVSSNTSGNSDITATYTNCSASININFIVPVYVTFGMNLANTGANALSVDSASYSNLPVTKLFSAASTHSYAYNTSVPVSTGSRYSFNSITGCGLSTQSGTIVANSNCTVTGNYIQQYYLSTSSSSGGSVSPSSGWYNSGAQVTLSETPNTGYTFTGWTGTGTGSYTGSSASPSVTLNNPITETANFQINQYTLTVNNNGCSSVSGGGTYNYGTSASFSVSVPGGYTFNGWTGSGAGSYSGGSTSSSVTMDNAITETATCSPPLVTVSASAGFGYSYTYECYGASGASGYCQSYCSPSGTLTITEGSNQWSSSGDSPSLSESVPQGSGVTVSVSSSNGAWTCSGSGCAAGGGSGVSVTANNNIGEYWETYGSSSCGGGGGGGGSGGQEGGSQAGGTGSTGGSSGGGGSGGGNG